MERQLPSKRDPRHHNSLRRSPVEDLNCLRQFLVTKESSNLHNLKYAPGIKPTDLFLHENGAELSNSKSIRRRVSFEVRPEDYFAARTPRRGNRVYGSEGSSLQTATVLNSPTDNYTPLLYQRSVDFADIHT